jgi:cytochrome b pre-mRNA-processing protein 3
VTDQLYKECAKQSDYKIAEATKGDAEIPKTEDGEDLGVGEGWWHTGKPSLFQGRWTLLILHRTGTEPIL